MAMLVRIRGNDPITLLVEFSFVDVPNRRNYLGAFFSLRNSSRSHWSSRSHE